MKKFLLFNLLFLLSIFYNLYSEEKETHPHEHFDISEYKLPRPEDFLTDEEIKWLKTHPVIRIAPDPEFAPFEFIDVDGKYKGIGADYLWVVAKILGIEFKILIYSNWSKIIEDFKLKKIDLLNTVFSNDIRNAYMLFPSPYLFIPTVIVARKGEARGISIDQLGRYRITMVKDYGLTGYFLEKYRGYKTILVGKISDALELLILRGADIFISDIATAEYYIRKFGFSNLEIIDVFKPDSIMGFGVRKDWPIFRDILEKTQKKIPPQLHNEILKRWINIDFAGKRLMKQTIFISLITLFVLLTLITILLSISWRLNLMVNERTERLQKELHRVKMLEKEIRESRNFLDNILNEMPLPLLITDETGLVIKLNLAFKETFFVPDKDFFSIEEIFESEEKRFLEKLKSVFKENKGKELSFGNIDLNCRDKRKHIFDVKFKRLESDFIFIFLDLTEILNLQKKLKESLKEKDMLIREIHHRVKNNFNIVISLLNLQKSRSTVDSVKESLSVAQNRIFSMALIHEMLYQSNQFTEVVLPQYVEKLLKYLKGLYSEIFERINFDLNLKENISLPMDSAIPCGMIINEILMNSFKHAFPDNRRGIIKIHIYREKNLLKIEIGDNGAGIKDIEGFSDKKTLGITLIESLVQQLKGKLSYENKNGLIYHIDIPLEK